MNAQPEPLNLPFTIDQVGLRRYYLQKQFVKLWFIGDLMFTLVLVLVLFDHISLWLMLVALTVGSATAGGLCAAILVFFMKNETQQMAEGVDVALYGDLLKIQTRWPKSDRLFLLQRLSEASIKQTWLMERASIQQLILSFGGGAPSTTVKVEGLENPDLAREQILAQARRALQAHHSAEVQEMVGKN
ncbi:MAG: hypothetical protein LAT83_19115 [Kiritimatiellae bacterium]|nr:hypothetical protein [Kiritimatiellia bacterium]